MPVTPSHRHIPALQDYRISSLDFSITLALTSNLGKGVDGEGDGAGRSNAGTRQEGVVTVRLLNNIGVLHCTALPCTVQQEVYLHPKPFSFPSFHVCLYSCPAGFACFS